MLVSTLDSHEKEYNAALERTHNYRKIRSAAASNIGLLLEWLAMILSQTRYQE
jgi:hypothetical protein